MGALCEADAVVAESGDFHGGDHGNVGLGDQHAADVFLAVIEGVLEPPFRPEIRVGRSVGQEAPHRGAVVGCAEAHRATNDDAAVGQRSHAVSLVRGEAVLKNVGAVRPKRRVEVALGIELEHRHIKVAHRSDDPAKDDASIVERDHILGVLKAGLSKRCEEEHAPVLKVRIQRSGLLAHHRQHQRPPRQEQTPS